MMPAHFIRILEVPEDERAAYDLSSLRLIVHARRAVPGEVKHRIIDALAAAARSGSCTAMSEGGATKISIRRSGSRGRGASGTPWPGVEVRILDDDGRRSPTGEAGLIYVMPPGGARFHYHDDPRRPTHAWRDDAFTVGDVGYVDADGYLFLTDRAADMVIRGGVNIYPREIEDVLYTHRPSSIARCSACPTNGYGEQLMAVVEVARRHRRRSAASVRAGTPGRLQGAGVDRARRRAAAPPQRQGPEARPPRTALVRLDRQDLDALLHPRTR